MDRKKRRNFKLSTYNAWFARRLKEAAHQVYVKTILDATYLSNAPVSSFTIRQMVDRHIFRVMEACNNNRTMAADLLGIHRRSLQRLLPGVYRHLGIGLPEFKITDDPELVEVLKRQRRGMRMYRRQPGHA